MLEELVAELRASSAVVSSDPRPDHAAYLASWLKALKADPRAIFAAASNAAQA